MILKKICLLITLSLTSVSITSTQAMDKSQQPAPPPEENVIPYDNSLLQQLPPELRSEVNKYHEAVKEQNAHPEAVKVYDKAVNVSKMIFLTEKEFQIKIIEDDLITPGPLNIILRISSEQGLNNLKKISEKNPNAFDNVKILEVEATPHIPKIRIGAIVPGVIEFICSDSGFKKLASLELHSQTLTLKDIKLISQSKNFSNLISLDLRTCDIDNEGAMIIAKSPYLKNLEYLYLNSWFGPKLDDESIKKAFPHLKKLTSN